MAEGLKTDQDLHERHLRAFTVSCLELAIKAREVRTSSRDLEDVYVDLLPDADGDNGNVNTSKTSLYYYSNGRMEHLNNNVYVLQRSDQTGDEFNDGSIDTNLWKIEEEPQDDFGNGRGVVNEGSGTLSLDSTSSDSGGDSYSNPCSATSKFSTRSIMVTKIQNTTVDGNDSGCPGGDSYLRFKVNGSTLASDHYWKDSDCGYNYESTNGGCAGTWTVVDGGNQSGVYKNGSRIRDSPGTGSVKYYAEADTWDSDGKAHMDVDYCQTWNFVDGSLVCENVESLANVESAVAQIKGVFPGNISFDVDLSLDGGSTWPDKLSGIPVAEVKHIEPHRVDENVSGNNLAVRLNAKTSNSGETPEIDSVGVKTWPN